jgi:hypothetical protein
MCGILTPATQAALLLKYWDPRDENEATSSKSFSRVGGIVKFVGEAEGLSEIEGSTLGKAVGLVGLLEGSFEGENVGAAVGRI